MLDTLKGMSSKRRKCLAKTSYASSKPPLDDIGSARLKGTKLHKGKMGKKGLSGTRNYF